MRISTKLFVLAAVAVLVSFVSVAHAEVVSVEPGAAVSGGGQTAEPQTYTLGAVLSCPRRVGVDEYGRFYVLDHARRSLMRFGLKGNLEKLWPEGFDYGYQPWGREDICVLSGERVYLCPVRGILDNERQIGPGNLDRLVPFKEQVPVIYSTAAFEDGSYFVSGYYRGAGYIYGYSADGQPKAHWTTPSIGRITAGPDGNIYVYSESRIIVYSQKGDVVREIHLSDNEWDFSSMTDGGDIAVDTNGDIYRGCSRFDREGKLLNKWKPWRASATGPAVESVTVRALAVRNGVVCAVVHNDSGMEIQILTPGGQCVVRYVSPKPRINMPGALGVQPDGSYLVEQHSGEQAILFAGEKTFTPEGWGSALQEIATIPGQGYYLSNGYEVVRTDINCKRVASIQKYTVLEDHTIRDSPERFVRDSSTGNLWTLCNNCPVWDLLVFGPDDKLQKRVCIKDALPFPGGKPGEMAIDPGKFLYVVDSWRNSVEKFDLEGNLLSKIGKEGAGIGELNHPVGIVVDDQGRIYVADCENNRIQVFSSDGESLGFWGKRGKGDGELDRPIGLAFGPNNALWISDTHNDRIVRVPMTDFWKSVSKVVAPTLVAEAPKHKPAPVVGKVVVSGITMAGTDDLTDCVYLESEDLLWGVKVFPPKDAFAPRRHKITVVGTLALSKSGSKDLIAESIDDISTGDVEIEPLGLANLYVGDGYRSSEGPNGPSNLNLLVKTWGEVMTVDQAQSRFTINDGSLPDGSHLLVTAANMRKSVTDWPKVGDYVAVTGVSVASLAGDGKHISQVRLRSKADLEVLANK